MEKFCLLVTHPFPRQIPPHFFSTTPAFGHPFYIEGESAARAAGAKRSKKIFPQRIKLSKTAGVVPSFFLLRKWKTSSTKLKKAIPFRCLMAIFPSCQTR